MGAEQTDMQNKLPPINSPSAGKDEKTTWGWFNALWSDNGMTSLLLCCTSVCLWIVLSMFISLCSQCSNNKLVNVIAFTVRHWQRWIIDWQSTILNLGILPTPHQSSRWPHCLWSHHPNSHRGGAGWKTPSANQTALLPLFLTLWMQQIIGKFRSWCHKSQIATNPLKLVSNYTDKR